MPRLPRKLHLRSFASLCSSDLSMSLSQTKKETGSDQARAPTLQGYSSLAPVGSLERIAQKTGVSESSLATVVVRKSAEQLYEAIIQYAAFNSTLDAKNCPIAIGCFDSSQDESDDEESDVDDDLVSTLSARKDRQSRISAVRLKMSRNQGLRQRQKLVPDRTFSYGETTIVWPPPPHLQAAALVEERDMKRKQKNNDTSNGSDIECPQSYNCDALQKGPDGDGRTIHLVHYVVGEPKSNSFGDFNVYAEVLLATPEGHKVIRSFTEEVVKWAADKAFCDGDGTKFALYRFKVDSEHRNWWSAEGMKRSRPPSSVILPKGQLKAIMNDVRSFVKGETKRWYFEHGLPHRRSYLFYGPPGTGKTSTIRAIASTFRLNCCFLSMTSAGFSNQDLCDALGKIPGRALIVLEDVDALFNEDRKNEQAGSLTFSGLLNALDGLVSTDGIITVMTTNHFDRLDKALIRGGRVDRRFFFNKPSNEQLKDLFLFFYPDAKEAIVQKFLDKVVERPEGEEARSIATLQQLFIDQRGNTSEDCVEAIPKFYEAHFPSGTDRGKVHFYT